MEGPSIRPFLMTGMLREPSLGQAHRTRRSEDGRCDCMFLLVSQVRYILPVPSRNSIS